MIKTDKKIPKTERAWFIWSIPLAFVFYQFLLQAFPSVMVPNLEKAFDISEFGVSLLSSGFFYPYILLQIPAGILMDRYNTRMVLTLCILSTALACGFFAFSTHFAPAEASRIIMGAAAAPAVVATLYFACRLFPPTTFALLAGVSEMVGMLGGASGQILLAFGVSTIGWKATLLIAMVIGLLLALLAFCIIKDKPPKTNESTDVKKMSIKQSLMCLLGSKQLMFSSIYCGLMFALIAGFAGFWCIPFLRRVHQFDLNLAAHASAMIFIGVAFGTPFFGWLSDKIGSRCKPMRMGAIASLILMCTVLYTPHLCPALIFIALFLLGFFSSSYIISFAIVRDRTSACMQGTAMGFTNMMCILIGAPVIQPLVGILLHLFDGYSTHIAYTISLSTLTIAIAMALGCCFLIEEL